MGEVSVIYVILAFVLLVLIIMIPVNVNQTRIYTRNIMRELEAIHQTLRDLAEKRAIHLQTLGKTALLSSVVGVVQWCRKIRYNGLGMCGFALRVLRRVGEGR